MAQTYNFSKLHGAGNDFVFIEDLNDSLTLNPSTVAKICDRHFGIGADGVIVVKPPKDPANDGFMHYINSDGTLAQMCGNGVRCFSKYLVDHSIVDKGKDVLRVETRAGVKTIGYSVDDQGKLLTATVDMGDPVLNPDLIPTTLEANATTEFGTPFVKDVALDSPYGTFAFTCVSMGNPHAVTFVDDIDCLNLEAVGAFFESHPAFPEKANIEFATPEIDGIAMRVYERGCGETLACGTGACATAVAAYLTGRGPQETLVKLRGGDLTIVYEPGSKVLMTGPAQEVFSGVITLD